MSSGVLSPEEVAALRSELNNGPHDQTERIDLAGGERALRRGLHNIERKLKLAERRIAASLRRLMSANIGMERTGPEILGPGQAQEFVDGFGVAVEFLAPGHGVVGLFGIDIHFSLSFVEQLFGGEFQPSGDDESPTQPSRSTLTDIEIQAVQPVVEEMAVLLADELAGASLELRPARVGVNFQVDKTAPGLLLWRLTSPIGVMGAMLYSPVLDLTLEDGPAFRPPRSWLAEHVSQAALEVSALLGAADLTISELISLEVGDTVRLDRSQADALPVLLEGTLKFEGQPVFRNGTFGIELQGDGVS